MRRSGGSLGFGLGFGLRIRRLVVGLGFRLRFGLAVFGGVRLLFGRLLAGGLEIGRIPAGALQLEAGGGKLLAIFRLAASRADRERLFRHLLQMLVGVAAGFTAVFVNRHG